MLLQIFRLSDFYMIWNNLVITHITAKIFTLYKNIKLECIFRD